ncbi:MAG: hypothetical protein RLY14_2018 [Planctomycetota bacterium]|jgi:chlorite dismutase
MNSPSHRPSDLPEPSIEPVQGWHCSHYFYRFNRTALASLSHSERLSGKVAWRELLTSHSESPQRLQTTIISGHKADFSLMMLDPNPLKIDRIHQQLLASPLGVALEPTYSFVSMSEISEYVPSPEQYAERLKHGGEDPATPAFAAKVSAYERRLPMMNEQRLRPEIPPWPAMCFYPMNKSRVVGANWFELPFSQRNEMMAEHAQSGMTFAGRVTQLVTVSVGIDDWEWGVTLWGRNPQYLKDIVYRMRFDKASAKYGEFGPFYVGYVADSAEILKHCCIV